jgi:hypothetical protein
LNFEKIVQHQKKGEKMAVKVNTMAGAADITFHISTGLLFSKENLSSNIGASAKAPSYTLSYSKNSLENIQA